MRPVAVLLATVNATPVAPLIPSAPEQGGARGDGAQRMRSTVPSRGSAAASWHPEEELSRAVGLERKSCCEPAEESETVFSENGVQVQQSSLVCLESVRSDERRQLFSSLSRRSSRSLRESSSRSCKRGKS